MVYRGGGAFLTRRPVCQRQTLCHWSFRNGLARSDSHSETPHSVIKEPGITLSNPTLVVLAVVVLVFIVLVAVVVIFIVLYSS